MDYSVALQRLTLKQLDQNTYNALIVGLVIRKQQPRQFTDARDNSLRGNLSFTLRDAPQDFINATYWGLFENAVTLSEKFHCGDVVEIWRPLIAVRKVTDQSEEYQPMVTSPFALKLNDQSDIVPHAGNIVKYQRLLTLPTKPPGFISISEIHQGGTSFERKYVDILAAVGNKGLVRNITSKTGKHFMLREVLVFDQTSPGIRLVLWEPECIERADSWDQRNTILYLTDVKLSWSDFHRAVVATVCSRTIITENPVYREAAILREYAETAPIENLNQLNWTSVILPEPNLIQNVMSVWEILNKLKKVTTAQVQQGVLFSAVVYASFTHFDLDGFSRILRKRCGLCKSLLNDDNHCTNPNCLATSEQRTEPPEVSFDLRVNIADHTGTLQNIRLTGKEAENVLKCSAQRFMQMTDDEKGFLKWKYLFENFKIKLSTHSGFMGKPVLYLVDAETANLYEAVNKTPVMFKQI